MLTLQALNNATPADFSALLQGVYEHSPWVAERASAARPFSTIAHLKHALVNVVREASRAEQTALLCAHPELAASVSLTDESSAEQDRAGLKHCTPDELAQLTALNTAYRQRFGWPFIVAVRGPRGTGLTRGEIIATLSRRLHHPAELEHAECLRQVHRIAELRLHDKLGVRSEQGEQVWDWADQLARHSDPEFQAQGLLTVTYLTEAHQACSAQLMQWMRDCGFDSVQRDAVGNVVGLYEGQDPNRPRLLTGSHFDTVRKAGKYDGRLGILVPMACVKALHRAGRRLPFGIEVVAFAEEEGQRYKVGFLASSALVGQFDPAWLEQRDAQGITLRQAMQAAGLSGQMSDIAALRRDPANYLGFVEVHIEQGPVLDELDLPLGVVSSINGSLRYDAEVRGLASHAGTTPMKRRFDAAAAVAELLLYVEARASAGQDLVGTVGQLEVPGGSINVVPGRCRFSLDLRAPKDADRDALGADVLAELARICERRGLNYTAELTMKAAAAPSDPVWQARWERAVQAQGLPVFRLPSGAGHDAMKLHLLMPQAMLFLRGGNGGISHNPLESISSDDAQLCVQAFGSLLDQLAQEFA